MTDSYIESDSVDQVIDNPKVVSLILSTGRNCRWGSEWTTLSSTFNTHDWVALKQDT